MTIKMAMKQGKKIEANAAARKRRQIDKVSEFMKRDEIGWKK